jgi:F0F1-type ATP synthase membrane subunit b/b'
MEKTDKRINNHTWFWRIIITAILTSMAAITTWNFSVTAQVPIVEERQSKIVKDLEENKKEHIEIQKKIDTNQQRLEDKLDTIQNILINRRNNDGDD